jgi:hypothetical protein
MILMVNLGASPNWGTWGIHINVWSNQSGTPNFPEWAKPFKKNNWQERGVVIWVRRPSKSPVVMLDRY